MSRVFLNWSAAAVILAVAAASLWGVVRRHPAKPSAVGFEAFVKGVSFTRQDDRRPLPDIIEVRKGAGIYADIAFIPPEILPDVFAGHPVQEPNGWPFALRIFPDGGSDAADAVTVRVERYQSLVVNAKDLMRQPASNWIPRGTTGFWQKEEGYQGPPPPRKASSKREVRLWTFIPPKLVTGAPARFELVAYPTAKMLSNVRARIGEPIIVREGTIRIVGGEGDVASSR